MLYLSSILYISMVYRQILYVFRQVTNDYSQVTYSISQLTYRYDYFFLPRYKTVIISTFVLFRNYDISQQSTSNLGL
jgi:hypothetical protein